LSERRGPDLSRLSDDDLRALRQRIDAELSHRFRSRQRGERARGGLLEGPAPRYRNPENPAETWSGRGPQPSWVEALRARGVRLEALSIEDDRPAPSREPKRGG
jgi:H-NS histone C-terminal domain